MPSISQLVRERIIRPPGLPHGKPSKAVWQEPPHATVADRQSENLPADVDVVIIGSGITGCAVAHTLLHDSSDTSLRVCVVEARQAVSGATGRNGGHLISDSGSLVAPLLPIIGEEAAREIVQFSEANIRCIKDLVAQLDSDTQDAVELREVVATAAFEDEGMFEEAKSGIERLDKLWPENPMKGNVLPTQEDTKPFNYSNKFHGILEQHGAAALWPYKLITKLFENLLDAYPTRFLLETNTPVLTVGYTDGDTAPYHINTQRGVLRAKKVIHCTNGFTGHLIPKLIGAIYPIRGTMSSQQPGAGFPLLGDKTSWSWFSKPSFDATTEMYSTGLYYAQQNANTGAIFIGGEHQKITNMLSSDDSVVPDEAQESLRLALPELLTDVQPLGEQRIWSGIMGFSSDGLPLIGRLDGAVTGRGGDGEWIAAGFNGHGMDKCWLSGKAIAEMALGGKRPEYLPRAFLLTADRLQRIGPDQSVANLTEMLGV